MITRKLDALNNNLLPAAQDASSARTLNANLGALEMTIANAYNFFDTYMDVLTQRLSPVLGKLLKGCDALALDSMKRDHPALDGIERPLVYCDRGFGAAIIREGVPFFGMTTNPFPLIQIPYAKLKDKCNLTSVLHEVGHQAFVRLGLQQEFPLRLKENMAKKNISPAIRNLFGLWCSEIGPDFWAFACSGTTQAAGIREILSLTPERVFAMHWGDPHPPPYLRVLIAFDWCSEFFGTGPWDDWRNAWKELYPLEIVDINAQEIYRQCLAAVPVLIKTLADQQWTCLQQRKLPALFQLNDVSPASMAAVAKLFQGNAMDFRNTRPCAQLGVFRQLQQEGRLTGEPLDEKMSAWLAALGTRYN